MNSGASTEVTPTIRNTRRIVFIILAIAILVPLGSCVAWRRGNTKALRALEDSARQRGEPVTPADLNGLYPKIPDEQNAFIALKTLWKSEDPSYGKSAWDEEDNVSSGQSYEKISADLPVLGENWQGSHTNSLSDVERAAAREFLNAKSNYLQSVRNALRLTNFRASYDFRQGFPKQLAHLSTMKREAQYFQIEALLAIDSQDPNNAIDAINTMSQLGNCLRDAPTLIEQLVRLAIFSIATTTTEKLMARCQLDQNQLLRLQAITAAMDARDGLQRAFKSERVMVLDLCRNHLRELLTVHISYLGQPPSGVWESAKTSMQISALTLSGLKDADLVLMAKTYEQLIEISSGPEYCVTDALNSSINAAIAEARRFPPKILTRLMLPALGKAGEKFGRFEAQRRCLLIAIEIEKLRRAHPASIASDWRNVIESQPGDLQKDPFATTRLQFAVTSNGYIIYSVGPDRTDNGGYVRDPDGRVSRATDIGYTIPLDPQK